MLAILFWSALNLSVKPWLTNRRLALRRPPILLQKLCELSTSPPWRWAISASPRADGGRAEWEATCPPEQRRLRAGTAGDAALLLVALAGAQNPPALSQLSFC